MTEFSELPQGQLEQSLWQKVRVLYLTQLGHQPNKISCQLVDKTLTIIIEDSITKLEQLLAESGNQGLAKEVRSSIHLTLEPHLKSLIEEVVKIPVLDLLSDSAFATGRTSIVAILAPTLEEGNHFDQAQAKQETGSDRDNDE